MFFLLLLFKSGGGSSPSLSFLPTSVMRHMHNSKSSQVVGLSFPYLKCLSLSPLLSDERCCADIFPLCIWKVGSRLVEWILCYLVLFIAGLILMCFFFVEFLTDAAYATQHSAENPFHSSQIPPSHSAHHYQYPQPHHTYRSNLRGHPWTHYLATNHPLNHHKYNNNT